MYAGHIGAALGARSLRRTIPIVVLLFAAELPDWVDVGMCVANINRGPFGLRSHGLAAIAAMAIIAAVVTLAFTEDWRGALLVAAVVCSHYLLDYFTGYKPTWTGGPVIGLNLYSQPIVDVVLETLVVLAGWLLYRRSLPEAARSGPTVYLMIAALVSLQLAAGIAFSISLGGHMKY